MAHPLHHNLAAILALSLLLGGSVSAAPDPPSVRVIQPFDFHGVTLEDGDFLRQIEEVRAYYLRIPNDDLLKGFRARAGLPAPGADLGGWYTGDTGHIFGQLISGYARFYAATGDTACRDKVNALLAEWGKCIESDGYFYYSRKPNFHYTYDKMVGGLVDAYLYCHNCDALTYLGRITDWAIKNLDRTRAYMNVKTEWYTLSENLYRAYLATGDEKYRQFAQVWEYRDYWDLYADKVDIFTRQPFINEDGKWYHAYSHVNTLSGAGAAYLVTGNPHYLDVLKNAYTWLQANEIFATGGYGPEERLLPPEELVRALSVWPNSCETQCCTWAGFKLAKYLLSFTGDAAYGDWAERLALNCIGATIPMTADGRVLYHISYNVYGGAKHNIAFGWSCCSGSRPSAVADYDDLTYFHDADSLYVNLFTSSAVQWPHAGGSVTIHQKTEFPEKPVTRLKIESPRPATFALKVRRPQWADGAITATVNGRVVKVEQDPRHWLVFNRKWRHGDELSITFPMHLWASPLGHGANAPVAILDGPVVLAARAPSQSAFEGMDFQHLDCALTPSPGEAMTYHLTANSNVLFRPFYSFKEGEPYYLYIDSQAPRRTLPGGNVVLGKGPDIQLTGSWTNLGLYYVSGATGSAATYSFDGTGIRWLGCSFDDAGKAEIKVDGLTVELVDQYGGGRDLPFAWERRGLLPGKHTLNLEVTGQKAEPSKGIAINVAGFEVIPR